MKSVTSIFSIWLASSAIIGIAAGFQQPQDRRRQNYHLNSRQTDLRKAAAVAPLNTKSRIPNVRTSGSTATSSATQLNAVSLSSSPIGALAVLAGIVVVHECGHYFAARAFNITVEEFSIGFGPKLFGFEALGNEFNLRALPLGGYVRFPENYDSEALEAYEVEYYDDPQLLQNRPWQERAVVLSGGVIFNLILSFSIYFAAIGPLPIGASQGLPRAIFDNGVVVAQAPRPDGPSSGLLQRGDIITGINGTSVAAGQQQVTDVISAIRATPDGESILDATSTKQTKTTVRIQPARADDTKVQSIGVMLSPKIDRLERLKSDNPIVAFQLAWEYLSDIFTQTLLGTLSVLTSFLSPTGPPPGQKISGPIGLISQGSSVVATKDWTAVLLFAAGLSVNLGVINALPLPALDGGQLVFVVAEAITGKKVDQKLQERVTSVAVLFLLWVSFSAAIGDVGSLFQ
eukprot:jgi/Psemu1/196865/e_gw1.194.31.1